MVFNTYALNLHPDWYMVLKQSAFVILQGLVLKHQDN